VPAQSVDATPSDINLLSKGGVYDARETGEAFRDTKDRPGPSYGPSPFAYKQKSAKKQQKAQRKAAKKISKPGQ
jgi:hypothetical protein